MKSTVLNRFEQTEGGSQDNKLILGGSVETESGSSLKKIYLTVNMADISSADTVYLPSPVAGKITRIQTVIDGTIATADALITTNINATPVTDGVVTITAAGSLAGDVDSATPSADNDVTVDDNINFVTNAASTNAVRATILLEIELI